MGYRFQEMWNNHGSDRQMLTVGHISFALTIALYVCVCEGMYFKIGRR